MRPWWWNATENDGAIFRVKFKPNGKNPVNIKEKADQIDWKRMIKASPEFVAAHEGMDPKAYHYMNEQHYKNHSFFVGSEKGTLGYGILDMMEIFEASLSYEHFGGGLYRKTYKDRADNSTAFQDRPEDETIFLISLLQEGWEVEHWKAMSLSDGVEVHIDGGDHQALIEYLQLDTPEAS